MPVYSPSTGRPVFAPSGLPAVSCACCGEPTGQWWRAKNCADNTFSPHFFQLGSIALPFYFKKDGKCYYITDLSQLITNPQPAPTQTTDYQTQASCSACVPVPPCLVCLPETPPTLTVIASGLSTYSKAEFCAVFAGYWENNPPNGSFVVPKLVPEFPSQVTPFRCKYGMYPGINAFTRFCSNDQIDNNPPLGEQQWSIFANLVDNDHITVIIGIINQATSNPPLNGGFGGTWKTPYATGLAALCAGQTVTLPRFDTPNINSTRLKTGSVQIRLNLDADADEGIGPEDL